MRFNFRLPARGGASWFLPLLAAAALPLSATAEVTASLTWTASPDTNVTGYNIYFGTASHSYSNSIAVSNVTSADIPNLLDATVYFFAAKAHNSAGTESDFSNEAAFAGFHAAPDTALRLKALPCNSTGDPLVFSLDSMAPPGATINPTNGTIYWTPGRDYASTTNDFNVLVTDAANPASNFTETVVVVVSDYLEFSLGAAAVAAGQTGSLPLTVAASSSVTNVQLTLAWPGDSLLNPTLTFVPPVVAGSLQSVNNQLLIQLQTDPSQPLTGTNQVAQVNFQTVAGQPTTIFNIPVTVAAGNTADGVAYANVVARAGEVAVVGASPLLRPESGAAGRTLSLFAAPGTYNLLYTTSLVPPISWTPLMTYQQTNVAQTVSLDPSAPVIFYRLQQL